MPKKITKLTPEQQAQFGEWAQKWIKIGLSTEPADFDIAEKSILQAYDLIGVKRPLIVLHMGSPYGAALGGLLAWQILQNLSRSQVASQVASQVWSQVWSQVASQVRSQVASQVWSQVWSQVRSQVASQVWSQVRSQVRSNLYLSQYLASWVSYITFFRDVCNWEDDTLKSFLVLENVVKSCGWIWWHENVVAISDRPEWIRQDTEGRLHSEIGPAIKYRDGWSLYFWRGISVPASWIEDKNSLTPKIALEQRNVEQRRIACEIIGWDKILKTLNAKTIDKDSDPMIGELLEVQLPQAPKSRFLRVVCGTGRTFAIPVPMTVKTALEANSWTYGVDKDLYKPEVRT